jgi:parallel beta-helix repeat protein
VIEDNEVSGNTNGILIVPGVEGTVINRNVVVGNPPVQVSNSTPGEQGVDIRNGATAGATSFKGNVCLTGVNAPCPAVSKHDDKDKKEK